MPKKTHIYLLYFLSLFPCLFYTQDQKYTVSKKTYNYANGLPGKQVTCGIQDKFGFFWFGTNYGLCRFDGKKFVNFTEKSHGLRERQISQLIADDSLGIIISYSEKNSPNVPLRKYDVINIKSFEVKPLSSHYKNLPFAENRIAFIQNDFRSKSVLFYLDNCYRLNPITFTQNPVWEYNKWVGFKKKQFKVLKTIEFISSRESDRAVVSEYRNGESLNSKAFVKFSDGSFYKHHNHMGRFITLDENKQLYVHEVKELNIKQYYLLNEKTLDIKSTNPFENEVYKKMIEFFDFGQVVFYGEGEHIKWANNGLLYLVTKENDYVNLLSELEVNQIHKTINEVIKDDLNNYWICTSDGLLKITLERNKFRKHFTTQQTKLIANHSARGIYAEKDLLIVGTDDFIGIGRKNDTSIIFLSSVFSTYKDSSNLWIGSFHLNTYNLGTNTKKIIYRNRTECGEVWCMYPVTKNNLLLGGTSQIINYNISKNKLDTLNNGGFKKPALVYKLFKNKKNELLAVANNGLYYLDDKGEKIIDCYTNKSLDKNKQLPFEGLNDVYEDDNGIYWLASASDGLFKWNRSNNTYEQFGLENGFSSLNTHRIEADDYGNLWVSTDYGLANFNKITKHAKIYTTIDGLAENEFNRVSSFKDTDGKLYFGGLNGIVSFHPKEFTKDTKAANFPFLVDKITCLNANTNSQETETITENKIELNDSKKSCSINFVFLDYQDVEHTYSYQIQGLSNYWVYTTEPIIKLNNLPYGNYNLKIRAQCVDGQWNKQEITLAINMQRPFYKTVWFIGIAIILFIALLVLYIKIRVYKIKQQNKKLEATVENRTSDLKRSLAEQVALLQEVHHRVKNNLQFIAAIIQMQMDTIKNESDKQVLNNTYRRINTMNLVHEMLYTKDNIESINIKDYLHQLISKLMDINENESKKVNYNITIQSVDFNINNCVSIGLITSEIISNSMKYAFALTHSPQINIKLEVNKDNSQITYCISDNGSGLNESKEINGLGMRLIDIFARQLDCTYEIKNTNGVTYLFNVPINNGK